MMTRALIMFAIALPALPSAFLGCDGDGRGSDVDSDTDTDSDTDSDSDSDSECDSGDFSFFVISLEKIQEWGGTEGLGGDLGGLDGADDYCQDAADAVGACDKTWRAFLSVTDDGDGNAVNAIDRIGDGPWFDVNGYKLADDIDGLLQTRPDGDTDLIDWGGFDPWPFNQCLTTELGNCNHSYGDTHDTLTGSDRDGTLISTNPATTCNDWTSTDVIVSLPIGHTWPRQLNSTNDDDANWIYSHSNCTTGPGPGSDCNGCGVNINIGDSMEDGVGGDGGYGAWYCFADLNE